MIEEVLTRYSQHVEFIGEQLNDVHQIGAFGSQVLHLASFAGNCSDVREILLAGAEINAIGDLGLSPLHYAVLGGNLDVIRLLVTEGANFRLENEFGETAAQMAHLMEQSDAENLLCEFGSSPSFSFDGGVVARERWSEFKSIQEENFWKESD